MKSGKQSATKAVPAAKTKRVVGPVTKTRSVVEIAETENHAPTLLAVEHPRQEGRYVYGIIAAKDYSSFGKMGIGGLGEMVYTVNHGDIAAVVSKTSVFIFDPTRENALAHEHVIETVMK